MKNILITGANSYIGDSFKKYLNDNFFGQYKIDIVDMIDGKWVEKSFAGYDAVYHVAGIAHIKETKENAELYYRINRDLPVEVAKKAKNDGVKQFVFMSSMSVYGLDIGEITKDTLPAPNSAYGMSKLQAEQELIKMGDESFKICILRPPMVYGNGCRGNFQSVIKITDKLPVFPYIKNKRSMIYIDNLCEFARKSIDENSHGVFFPQNSEYMNISKMALWIGQAKGKKIFLSRILGVFVSVLSLFNKTSRKAFGSLIYKNTEQSDYDYCLIDNELSVKKSVM